LYIASEYPGPVLIAQDLMVINVTPGQIVTQMAKTDTPSWAAPAPPPPPGAKQPELDPPVTKGRAPQQLVDTRLTGHE